MAKMINIYLEKVFLTSYKEYQLFDMFKETSNCPCQFHYEYNYYNLITKLQINLHTMPLILVIV